ncbi:hypothetical protein O0L34_g564 [Tuta absoluta]|nr:hypothetical protein O0L34_g564 [Tuta absoluta]
MDSTVASKLQKKKINKGKLKKTIKNLLCRPDAVFWPAVTEDQKKRVDAVLNKYKVPLPQYKKPHWKDLKSLPKDQRPIPPTIKKVEGLIFGITKCNDAIRNGKCSGIIIESSVNPRTIVQPVLESCMDRRVPVICFDGLRKTTKSYFGIPTSCLGIKKECLEDVREVIHQLGSVMLPVKNQASVNIEDVEMADDKKNTSPMDIAEPVPFEYLYRTEKKSRTFVPPSEQKVERVDKQFKGQDFIEFSEELQQNNKTFKKMIVKRISNNPNRNKAK